MKTHQVKKSILVIFTTIITQISIFAQQENVPKNLVDSTEIYSTKLSKNELQLNLVDGHYKKGYLGSFMTDSILLFNNYGDSKTSVNDILNIKVIKKKENKAIGTFLGIVIGSLPGILMINGTKRREKSLVDVLVVPAELALGTTITLGGAIAGGIIGRNMSKGVTVTYPINASNDLYKRQKEKIIKEAFSR